MELVTGCQTCSEVLFIDSSPDRFDALFVEVFELFQKLQLVIYANYFITYLVCFHLPQIKTFGKKQKN